eukprot:Em0001g1383a
MSFYTAEKSVKCSPVDDCKEPDCNPDGPGDCNADGPDDCNPDGPGDCNADGPDDCNQDGPGDCNADGPDDCNPDGPGDCNADGPDDCNPDGPGDCNADGPDDCNQDGLAMEDLLLGDISDFISSLIRLVRCVDSCIEDRFRTTNGNVGRGRPRIELEEEKLRFLIENGFKVQDIAIMLDCSLRTLERRLQELGITSRAYSRISDDELDLIVSQIKHCSQSCGEKLVTGRLRSAGIVVPRERGQLDGFRSGWCQHSIRTEGNRTPLQLWTMGLCTMDESSSSCMVARGLVEPDSESYGIDWNGPVPLNIEHEQVIVDDPPVLLSATQKAALDQQLHTSMIPGSECSIEQSLINHFMVAKLFVHSLHPQ